MVDYKEELKLLGQENQFISNLITCKKVLNTVEGIQNLLSKVESYKSMKTLTFYNSITWFFTSASW